MKFPKENSQKSLVNDSARGGAGERSLSLGSPPSARGGTQKTTMIHIFRIYSKPSFGSLPNLFFRAKAGSLIVPVLIPSRRNALHSGGVGGGGGGGGGGGRSSVHSATPIFNRFPLRSIPPPHQRPLSIFPDSPSPILASRLYFPSPTLLITCILRCCHVPAPRRVLH